MAKVNIRKTQIFIDYYERLKTIALSLFEWEGLPHTCNERFLEKCLYEDGRAVFLEDENMKFLNVRVVPNTELNVYEESKNYHCFSVGYDKECSDDECVYIRNNYLEKATESTIMLFAERLANIQLTIDVNIHAQKTPILIRTDEKTKTSLNTIYNQYSEDRPMILATKSLDTKPLEVLKTDAPFLADKLREEKREVWNEALEFLGINTNPSDKKKERLVVTEVESNNEQIDIQADTMLLCRVDACKRINKMFGLNVSVKRRVKKESEDDLWQSTQLNLDK